MSIHTNLPIHRTGVKLLELAVDAQAQMPRGVKRSLGDKISQHCVETLDLMALANATQREERAYHIDELMKRQRAATVLLRGQVTQEDADDILRTLMAIGLTAQTAATVANTLLCAQVLEPFGYFKPEPFGWTDCAADDEGAIALYERPQEVGLTASQFDLICQAIDKADTATMECDYMLDSDDCIAVVRVMQVLFDIEALREKQVAKLDYESMYCWLTAGKRGDWIWNHVLTDEEKNLGNDINTVVIAALRAKGGK